MKVLSGVTLFEKVPFASWCQLVFGQADLGPRLHGCLILRLPLTPIRRALAAYDIYCSERYCMSVHVLQRHVVWSISDRLIYVLACASLEDLLPWGRLALSGCCLFESPSRETRSFLPTVHSR